MAQDIRKPAQTYQIKVGAKDDGTPIIKPFRFGNLALIAIEKEWKSINRFMREFANLNEPNEYGEIDGGQVMHVMATCFVAGLAHIGFQMRDIDTIATEDLQEAFGPVMEAFAESFGFTRNSEDEADAESGEAQAAPAA